jgi:hypothetical protein
MLLFGIVGRHGTNVGKPPAGRVSDTFDRRGCRWSEAFEFVFQAKTLNFREYFKTTNSTHDFEFISVWDGCKKTRRARSRKFHKNLQTMENLAIVCDGVSIWQSFVMMDAYTNAYSILGHVRISCPESITVCVVPVKWSARTAHRSNY